MQFFCEYNPPARKNSCFRAAIKFEHRLCTEIICIFSCSPKWWWTQRWIQQRSVPECRNVRIYFLHCEAMRKSSSNIRHHMNAVGTNAISATLKRNDTHRKRTLLTKGQYAAKTMNYPCRDCDKYGNWKREIITDGTPPEGIKALETSESSMVKKDPIHLVEES